MSRNIHVIALLTCAMFYITGCGIHRGNETGYITVRYGEYGALDNGDRTEKKREDGTREEAAFFHKSFMPFHPEPKASLPRNE